MRSKGLVEIGTIVAFIQYIQQFFVPIRDFSAKYAVMQSSMTAAERIFALLDTPQAPVPAAPRVPEVVRGEIVFEHVWFAYRGEDWVLRDVSFRIAPGEHVAIVGATGSGKTTLIKLLDRLYDVQRGRILVDGVDVREWDPGVLRRRIAVVLQDVFLFSGRVDANIHLGRPEIDAAAVTAAATRVNADRFIERMGGYDARGPRARQQPLRRPAPAARLRPRARPRPGDPGAGRGDLERRSGDGVADPGRADEAPGPADGAW